MSSLLGQSPPVERHRPLAKPEGATFTFKSSLGARVVGASVDWRREHDRPAESVFRVRKVLWIEPDPSFDMALLQIDDKGDEGAAQPSFIPMITAEEMRTLGAGSWLAVIGYPARDSRNRDDDQQRIFDGIYNVKRLAPGQVTALRPDGLLTHDATTLGGNSGSAVIELGTGKVMALHFGGIEGESNYAVQAPRLAEILRAHAT